MGAFPTDPVKIPASAVRWLGPNILVVEFVTPHEGFMLPRLVMGITVKTRDGHKLQLKGTVVESESSPRGPHAAGMVVRLAISVGMNPTWKAASEVAVTWSGQVDSYIGPRLGPWEIRFSAPERPEAPTT